ncbi:hypothetical protein IKF12_02950 [Candidatus Saccharibacteria bacterium]|nr:hypothetical protein [Candidatus Saccharibacteria bacterium]MBR3144124.1 hypothetical protein [Candidatus Saccharibacteria bacterium]
MRNNEIIVEETKGSDDNFIVSQDETSAVQKTVDELAGFLYSLYKRKNKS